MPLLANLIIILESSYIIKRELNGLHMVHTIQYFHPTLYSSVSVLHKLDEDAHPEFDQEATQTMKGKHNVSN